MALAIIAVIVAALYAGWLWRLRQVTLFRNVCVGEMFENTQYLIYHAIHRHYINLNVANWIVFTQWARFDQASVSRMVFQFWKPLTVDTWWPSGLFVTKEELEQYSDTYDELESTRIA